MRTFTTHILLLVKIGLVSMAAESGDQVSPPTQEAEDAMEATHIDVADFFPEVSDDLAEVTWAHRVNHAPELEAMLADPKIMMLEADVLLGHLGEEEEAKEETEEKQQEEQEEEKGKGSGSRQAVPIMAHPPEKESDLTVAMWLDRVIQANQEGKRKGIKLDFKEMIVVKESLDELNKRKDKITFPVWLNADIISGPINSKVTPPLPPAEFLTTCADHFPQALLSLGWTTYVPPTNTGAVEVGYGRAQMEAMAEVLDTHSITQPVTFAVRAAFVPHSIEDLEWLLETVPDSTVTIWSAPTDPFDPVALLTLRDLLGHDTVFLDLPPAQMTLYQEAAAAAAAASGVTGGTGGAGGGKFHLLPSSASVWATVGVALASALAALYLYE